MRSLLRRILPPLVAAAAGAVLAVPAQALDLSGTITVRETSTKDIGGSREVTTVWTLTGRLARGRAPATPEVRVYADRTQYTLADGEPVCYQERFDGWVPGPQNPVTQIVAIDLRAKDMLRRRARGIVTLADSGPLALTSGGPCGEFLPNDPERLVGSSNQGDGIYRDALMGLGNLELRRRNSVGTIGAQEYLAPGLVTFRLAGGRWRADGVRVRSGRYSAGVYGTGARTVRVEWHLRSRNPAAECLLPPRSRVRGRTLAQVRRILRRAGLRPGRPLADPWARAPRGRVAGLFTLGFDSLRCGSRVSPVVRR